MFEIIIVLFLLFVIVSVLDIWSTKIALAKQGNYEANKFLDILMKKFGVSKTLVLVKIAAISIVWGSIVYAQQQDPTNLHILAGALVALNLLYGVVVYNNLVLGGEIQGKPVITENDD